MPYHGFSCLTEANSRKTATILARLLNAVLVPFRVEKAVDKFVGARDSEKQGESATQLADLRHEGRKILFGRSIEPAAAQVQKIRVGDDRRPAPAQLAAGEQAGVGDDAAPAGPDQGPGRGCQHILPAERGLPGAALFGCLEPETPMLQQSGVGEGDRRPRRVA